MRSTLPLAALSSLLIFAFPSIGEAKKNPVELKKWIADLDSPNFAARDRAGKELLAMKESALAPLKEALKDSSKSLEFRRRVQMLIDDLKVFERDGEAVGALRLSLMASNDTLAVGDEMTLITTLCNEGRESMLIYVGWRSNLNDFVQGSGLFCMTDHLQAPEIRKVYKERSRTPIILSRGQSASYQTKVTLRANQHKKGKLELDIGFGEASVELPTSGVVRLRMVHIVEPDDAFRLPRELRGFRGVVWQGNVRSNDVDVKLISGPD